MSFELGMILASREDVRPAMFDAWSSSDRTSSTLSTELNWRWAARLTDTDEKGIFAPTE